MRRRTPRGYPLTLRLADNWHFPEKRPLKMAEVLASVRERGVLTQGIVPVRKHARRCYPLTAARGNCR